MFVLASFSARPAEAPWSLIFSTLLTSTRTLTFVPTVREQKTTALTKNAKKQETKTKRIVFSHWRGCIFQGNSGLLRDRGCTFQGNLGLLLDRGRTFHGNPGLLLDRGCTFQGNPGLPRDRDRILCNPGLRRLLVAPTSKLLWWQDGTVVAGLL